MKRLFAIPLALGICAAPFHAFAEEDVTAESLLQAMQEYSKDVTSMTVPMTMNLDASVLISAEAMEMNLDVLMSGEFNVQAILDPISVAMNGSFELSAMGMNEEMTMDMYMITSEDGSVVDTYANVEADEEESGWQHTSVDMSTLLESFGVSSMDELNSLSMEDLFGTDLTLDWTVEETDDTYELSSKILFSDLMPVIEESLALSEEELDDTYLALAETVLSAFSVNMSYTLDKDTKAALAMHIDFNDSDMDILSQLITSLMSYMDAEETDGTELEITLNDFSIDATYSYDDVAEIVVPEEALNAEEIDSSELLDDLEV